MRAAGAMVVGAWIGAVVLLGRLEEIRPRWAGTEGARYLELATQARPALLGFDALAADVVWLEAIQYLADRMRAEQDLSGFYAFVDAATEFDPRYQHVYWFGGTALVALDRRPDEAVRLLEKGRRAIPDDWQIPYLLGYTHLFYYQDYATAADYIEEAARKVGRPTFYPRLAAKLRAQTGDPDAALAFLDEMRRSASDPAFRAGIEARMREVVVDRDLRAIDAAAERYRAARGRPPGTVAELVRSGVLAAAPSEPFGGRYVIDPQSGRAASTSGHGYLKLYTPPA